MTQPLKWRHVGPQDYRATLPDGTEAKVSGRFVDDRDYDGGWAGWQWGAQVNDTYLTDGWRDFMREAKEDVQQYVDRITETKD
jgi:hypothetical protein